MKKMEVRLNTVYLQKRFYGRQREVAAEMGIHPTTLSRKISNIIPVTLGEVSFLSEILGDSILNILEFTDESIGRGNGDAVEAI